MAYLSNPADVLVHAQRIYADNADKLGSKVYISPEEARMAARQLVADLSLQSSEPIGVSIMKQQAPDRASLPTTVPNIHQTTVQISSAAAGLRSAGPRTKLTECPYCSEPWRRFCPECGRRHESQQEKYLRLWRTIFKQVEFSSKMANLGRLEKPNTCAEEFFVEL